MNSGVQSLSGKELTLLTCSVYKQQHLSVKQENFLVIKAGFLIMIATIAAITGQNVQQSWRSYGNHTSVIIQGLEGGS